MLAKLSAASGVLRAHPAVSDATLATAFAAASLVPLLVHPDGTQAGLHATRIPVNVALLLAGTLALIWRRRAPVVTLAAVLIAFALLRAGSLHTTALAMAVLLAAFTVGEHTRLRVGAPAIACCLPVLVTLVALDRPPAGLFGYAGVVAAFCAAWWIGRSRRLRHAYVAELEQRAQQLARASAAGARAVRAEERARIARDLHDVLAHHVSVMTVQASAAQRVLRTNPDATRGALATIESTGRIVLEEMRRLVGVLRVPATTTDGEATQFPDDLGGSRTPQPSLADIPCLADRLGQTGLIVALDMAQAPTALPPGIGLAAYRIVQEALTNTLKHAGPPARAEVIVSCQDDRMIVRVRDDGRGLALAAPANDDPDRPRHGLVGMRERAALYGGQLRASALPSGGFEVTATFPLDGARAT